MPLGHLYEEDPISYSIASECPGNNPAYPKYRNPGQYDQESGKLDQLLKKKTINPEMIRMLKVLHYDFKEVVIIMFMMLLLLLSHFSRVRLCATP